MLAATGHNFSPQRLRLGRRRRGLTKVALADLVDLTPRRIAAFENEGEVPPNATIAKLATALTFPESFFTAPAVAELAPEAVSFRSFSRLPANKRDAALASGSLAIEVFEWFGRRFALPTTALPDLRDADPVAAALALRSEWGLGLDPAPNLVHVLEAQGVRVVALADECADLDALSFWHGSQPFMSLTTHKSPERARWDAAHELGHLVLHLGASPQGRKYEDEADAFASEFLLPERSVRARANRFPSLGDIRREKMVWRVSTIALTRRLHDLGIITDRRYRSLAVEASRAGFRRSEGDIEREVSKVVPQVFEMLNEDGVSFRDVATELFLAPSDLEGLLLTASQDPQGIAGSPAVRRHLRSV